MGLPLSWADMNNKLKELYPDPGDRGKIRKALLDVDLATACRYFEEDGDAAVKATLDALIGLGVPRLINTFSLSCSSWMCSSCSG